MADVALTGQPGELRFTLEITRAATGLTETVEMVGTITADEQEDQINGSHTLDGGA